MTYTVGCGVPPVAPSVGPGRVQENDTDTDTETETDTVTVIDTVTVGLLDGCGLLDGSGVRGVVGAVGALEGGTPGGRDGGLLPGGCDAGGARLFDGDDANVDDGAVNETEPGARGLAGAGANRLPPKMTAAAATVTGTTTAYHTAAAQ